MGDWPSILSVLSTRSTKWKQAFELPMDCHSPSERQSSAHIAIFLFKLIPENSRLVVYVSTTCFQELGPFLQTFLRLNHKNKNSSHKLRKRWIVCSHGNQWPPEPVLNLCSYDNPPQLTALVSKPASPWWPLASESQLVRDRLSPDLSGVNSHSPSDCPAEGISPLMSVKFTGPWPSDVPKTLYQCNSLLCLGTVPDQLWLISDTEWWSRHPLKDEMWNWRQPHEVDDIQLFMTCKNGNFIWLNHTSLNIMRVRSLPCLAPDFAIPLPFAFCAPTTLAFFFRAFNTPWPPSPSLPPLHPLHLLCPLFGGLPFQLHPLFLVDSSNLSRPAKYHLLREAFLAPALGEIHVLCALLYLSFGARVTVNITAKADRWHLCSTYSCKHFTCINSLHLHNHLLRWIYLFSQSKNLRHRALNVQSHRACEWSSRDLDPGGQPLEPSLYIIHIFVCVN